MQSVCKDSVCFKRFAVQSECLLTEHLLIHWTSIFVSGSPLLWNVLENFDKTVVEIFEAEYIRSPTPADTSRILKHSASRGFLGMLGSVDCTHWTWKNCPVGWAGQYQDRKGSKLIILEAVYTFDLHIWHAFFGCPGSLNDINVSDKSHLFYDLLQGKCPQVSFSVNNVVFQQPYYLADRIYPPWAVFVQTISDSIDPKQKYFATRQEGARKDIERAFGVLQARWAILQHPSRLWQPETLHLVIKTCLILHNMVVEDEQSRVLDCLDWPDVIVVPVVQPPEQTWETRFSRYAAARVAMRNIGSYDLLKESLIEHLWTMKQQSGA